MDQAGESNDRGAAAPNSAALAAVLAELRSHAAADPFSNPILLFALNLTRRIDRGEITLDGLETLIQDLTVEAFAERAASLRRYLGETDPAANERAIEAIIEGLAQSASAGLEPAAAFDQFCGRIERPSFGIVFTAHPTFSISLELARALAELAVGADRDGTPLDAAGRAARLALARRTAHRPPADLTLAVEHQWSVEALHHAHTALDRVNRAALRIARQRWPDRWTTLTPRMVTLATWVGYDQDGRTDITWMRSFAIRLADKHAALQSHLHTIAGLNGAAAGDFAAALEPIAAMLIEAIATVNGQAELLAAAEHDGAETAAFGRAMAGGRDAALAETKPLEALVDAAIARTPDDARRETLLAMRASLRTHGLGLAHVHVRLNASQLHNAVRRLVRLDTEPNDPANRRSYFNSINDLLDRVQPAKISFATLIDEQASAKRLIMTVAQMVKFVDAETPIRFLIAETETGFTLLTALYYARLFGVADQIEMSPLFETEEAFERGERVIDEALKSPHYRDYLKRQGRIAVQFGFSDSGRFIGQMAATFRIERLRLRLAQLLERHGLAGLEIILFNTHGESIGRGGHPLTLGDRLRYAAPPASRAEFERRGIRVKEEVSFQGGDGYLRFFTPAAAIASMRGILEFSLVDEAEAINDPIYAAPDYAAEFFATIQQEFTSLVEDPDYAALLGLFRGNLLFRTGSRPVAREAEGWARPIALGHPSQLRAIPNNAILQQLGFFANTLHGVGRAAAKDPEMFAAMRERSPRFRRALELVGAALDATDLDVLRAYTYTVDPGVWLTHSGRTRSIVRAKALRELARLTENLARHDRVARLIRRLQADHLRLVELMQPHESPRRDRLILLHAIRMAVIQRICLIATEIPAFSSQQDVTRDDLLGRILELDVASAVDRLARIFPRQENGVVVADDFGEPANYRPEPALTYAVEHGALFGPLNQLYDLARRIGSAITYETGAIG